MDMKLKSNNLHQHVMNTLYSDKSLCDTVLRAGQASYLCHAAVIASSSSLLRCALDDPQVENLNELVTIILAGWTSEEAELYIKQTYNQVDVLLPEDLVKVESVLSFRVSPSVGCIWWPDLFQEKEDPKSEPFDDDFDDYNDDLGMENMESLDDPSPSSPKEKLHKVKSKKKRRSSVSNLNEDSGAGFIDFILEHGKP